jgi:hypothetical protein
MITAEMALKMGAKKLKEFLVKKDGKFEFTIAEASDWVRENSEGIELKGSVNEEGNFTITITAKPE